MIEGVCASSTGSTIRIEEASAGLADRIASRIPALVGHFTARLPLKRCARLWQYAFEKLNKWSYAVSVRGRRQREHRPFSLVTVQGRKADCGCVNGRVIEAREGRRAWPRFCRKTSH